MSQVSDFFFWSLPLGESNYGLTSSSWWLMIENRISWNVFFFVIDLNFSLWVSEDAVLERIAPLNPNNQKLLWTDGRIYRVNPPAADYSCLLGFLCYILMFPLFKSQFPSLSWWKCCQSWFWTSWMLWASFRRQNTQNQYWLSRYCFNRESKDDSRL